MTNIEMVSADLFDFFSDRGKAPSETYWLNEDELRATWDRIKERVVTEWAKAHPGTRPLHWWRFGNREPRQRLGGVGDPIWISCPAVVPLYQFGIPALWLTPGKAATFAKVLAEDGDTFVGTPVDPSNPPLFESEAAYLQRLRLLLPGEERRLAADAFAPVAFAPGEAIP